MTDFDRWFVKYSKKNTKFNHDTLFYLKGFLQDAWNAATETSETIDVPPCGVCGSNKTRYVWTVECDECKRIKEYCNPQIMCPYLVGGVCGKNGKICGVEKKISV